VEALICGTKSLTLPDCKNVPCLITKYIIAEKPIIVVA
jgi:hypothetical protein